MQTLEKKNNIEKYCEKKNYSQPQLQEIGKVNNITKGDGAFPFFDGSIFQRPSSSS